MKTLSICVLCLLLSGFSFLPTVAQDETMPPPANPEDVASLDSIVETLYGVISGDKGVARDWNRFLSLFKPGAYLIPSGPNKENAISLNHWTPKEYSEKANGWLTENGFFEVEVARKEQHFGSMTHIWSTYESRNKADDPEPFARGINSIQLLNDGERWWIINIYWTAERENLTIPEEYLPE